MQIDNLMIAAGPSIYYSQSFRDVLEDHLTYLKNHSTTNVLSIEPMKAYKYEFDLYSLLREYNIPTHLHWLVMRLNDMVSPTDATVKIDHLIIPDFSTVDRIRQSHVTTRRIN